jgi:hypothetical protein
MVDEIQTIFANSPTKPPSAPSVATNAKLGVNAKLDVSIGSVHLHVRAAKAVWLRWDVGKVYFSRQASQEDVRFGIRVALQLVGAYTSNRRSKIRDASTIRLPSLNAIGSHRSIKGRPHLSATISLGCFIGILKPAVLDRLLSLHQSLRTDVMDFVQEYRYSIRKALKARRKKDPPTSSVRSVSAGATGFSKILFDLRLDVAGVRFGLKADDVASTLLFEAFALKGHATNQTTQDAAVLWRAKVQHFGLSLGHLGTADLPNEVEPSRKHRSAYMVVDVDVKEIPGAAGATSQLNVYLSRVHTVMHIAALSELSDLVRSWQSDVHSLRDHRATEVAEVREQTTRIFQNLETNEKTTTPEASWFANRLFTIDLTGLGIAIPLDEAAAIDLLQRESSTTPALLFSIRVISFHNRRNETARFKVQQTVLQFIDK